MKPHNLIALLGLTTSFASWAINFAPGDTIPAAAVKSHGEVLLNSDDISYQSWDTQQMLGKTRVIQAIAGRSAAKALNKPLMEAITASQFPAGQYQTTTIINQDDAMWGTGGFVKSSAEDSKVDFPHSSIVLDENGAVAKAWELETENSMIAVQNPEGQILWVKEGALSDEEIQQVLALIKENLQQ